MTIDEILESYPTDSKEDFYSKSRDRVLNAHLASFVKDMAIMKSTGLGFILPPEIYLDYAANDWHIATQKEKQNYIERMQLGLEVLNKMWE